MEVEYGDYSTTPKAEHMGTRALNPFNVPERATPIRSAGESETRHGGVTYRNALGELIKSEQLEQVLMPRGSISDVNSNIFGVPSITRMNHGRLLEQYVASTLGPDQQAMIKPNEDGSYEVIKVGDEPTSAQKALLYNRQQLREGNEEHSRKLLSDSEYFNRKLMLNAGNADFDGNALNIPEPAPERLLPRFIFEPNTILHQDIEKVTCKVRLPYPKCIFIQQPPLADYAEVVMNDFTDEVLSIELSPTKFLFACTNHGRHILVQVNQFRNKDDDSKVFYKAFLAQGPDMLLARDEPEHQYKDQIFAYIAPIFAFLEGLAVGMYSLKREGVREVSDKMPPAAKEGITFKVLRMVPDRDSQEYIPKGGTHASPREHERRAYTRMGANGKVQHIPATTVNKGKTPGGLVIKDYNIKDPKK